MLPRSLSLCLSLSLSLSQVLGFDCEWVTLQGYTRPVSLLQLATPSGLCVLVRLMHLDLVPDTLRDLMADKR